jgi:clan AA aspartic protease
MGLIHTNLSLSNPKRSDLSSMTVTAMADSGALHLCMPEHVALQLQLEEQEKREVTLVDGSKRLISYVGPVTVRFGNRTCFTGAMVLGDEVLLGAIPMEDMDLVLRPTMRDVIANPMNPNIPASIAKGYR